MNEIVERRIKMRPSEVRDFVAVATKCDFDIDISYNRYTIDAKSIVGVLGLDFTKLLTVRYNGYNEEFECFLKRLSCAS